MQDTPYTEMYDIKKEKASKETISFMALIHRVPKQVADSAQTQGVSEKFLESGMPSGVLTPSQIAHDRMLSIFDAFQDSVILAFWIAFLPLLEVSKFTIGLVLLILFYWLFHVAWWEKSKAWYIKMSVIRYIHNTYKYYWFVFFVSMSSVSAALWYFVYYLGSHMVAISYINKGLEFLSMTERAFADITRDSEKFAGYFDAQAQYHISMAAAEYQERFLLVAVVFIGLTLGAKLFFGSLYLKERKFNATAAESEMAYAGENALRRLREEG